MSDYQLETFIGSGRVLFGGFNVGNVTALSHKIETETKSIKARNGGGTYDSITQVLGVQVEMKVSDFNDANLELALQALKIEHVGGAQTETLTAIAGGEMPLEFQPDGETPYTVATPDDATTYVLDTDYEETPLGIKFLAAGDIANDAAIKVAYTSVGGTAFEALAASQKEGLLVVDGLNDANGEPFTLSYYRFKVKPMATLAPFSDEFAELELNGDALADATKGVGQSKFMRMRKAPSVKSA